MVFKAVFHGIIPRGLCHFLHRENRKHNSVSWEILPIMYPVIMTYLHSIKSNYHGI